MWMVGCATPPSDKNWLRIGVTKEEVIKHYGEPDLVQRSAEGEIALYRALPSEIRRVPSIFLRSNQAPSEPQLQNRARSSLALVQETCRPAAVRVVVNPHFAPRPFVGRCRRHVHHNWRS